MTAAEPRGGGGWFPTSPYTWESADYLGSMIRIVVSFGPIPNGGTQHPITGVEVYRDEACEFTRVLIGLGPDGSPETTPYQFDVPAGTTVLNNGQINYFAGIGLDSMEDMLATNITASGPVSP